MFFRHRPNQYDDRRFARDALGGGRWGHGHHGRHFAGGGMRPGRLFDHGDLRYILLKLIADKPRHGYELIKDIEEQLGGMYSPSPGVVYPTLTLLEELGYVTATPEGTKKLYTATESGTQFLAANQQVVDAIFGRMAEAARAFGGGPAPEIVRAMQNLRAALAVRLRKGPLSGEQVSAITTILDRAVGEIERS
jgi:DNA-binding PadR family transcriptional regulator